MLWSYVYTCIHTQALYLSLNTLNQLLYIASQLMHFSILTEALKSYLTLTFKHYYSNEKLGQDAKLL